MKKNPKKILKIILLNIQTTEIGLILKNLNSKSDKNKL